MSLLERGGTREEVSRKRRREPGQRENLLFLLLFFSTSFPFSQPLSSLSSTTNLPSPSNSLASALHLRAAASIPSSSRSYAATTLSTSSAPNYFPHLSKSSPASPSVSQARVAGATLRGRDRAPRTSMSDPETVYAAKASSAAQATQPLTSAGTIDHRPPLQLRVQAPLDVGRLEHARLHRARDPRVRGVPGRVYGRRGEPAEALDGGAGVCERREDSFELMR